MCPVLFNSARAFVALGSWLCVEGTKYVCHQGLLRMDLLLTAMGVAKRERIFSRSSFYCGRHVTPRGCWYSVKQDHQFLNKISTKKMDSVTRVQILDEVNSILHNVNTLGKGMNPIVLPPATDIVEQTWVLYLWLGNQSLRRKTLAWNQLNSAIKLTLFYILPVHRGW